MTPKRKYSDKHILACFNDWENLYGELPRVVDWTPTRNSEQAKTVMEQLRIPHAQTVISRFGSWENAKTNYTATKTRKENDRENN